MMFEQRTKIGQLSNQILEVPLLGSHHRNCSTSSLACNIYFHTWEPPFHSTRAGICFLQYLFHKKLGHKVHCVQNFHYDLACMDLETSNMDLKPRPSSFLGMHTLLQLDLCLDLSVSSLLQKNLAKIL